MARRLVAVLPALALAACSVFGIREAPTPVYRVIGHVGAVEIRQYGQRLAAETWVQAGEIDARSIGFRRIAGYIFGGNQGSRKIAMTALVAQQQAGEKIAMTAPVATERDGEGAWRIRFFMPAGYTMATLPVPDDKRVALVIVPAQTMAVLRYSGGIGAGTVASHTGELIRALEGSAWRPTGEPVAWFYDPPWTLPPLRRNEVSVPVSPR